MKKIVFLYFGLIFFAMSVQAQIDTRQTGDYNACLTWTNQDMIGYSTAQILSGNTVTLRNDAIAYQSLSFQDGSSVLDLNGKTLNVNTVPGRINMDYCPVSFQVSSYTSNSNGCTPLWGGANNNWPYTYPGTEMSDRQCITVATIQIPGNYRLLDNTLAIIATLPNGDGYSGCWGSDFYIDARVTKNGNMVGGLYVLDNNSPTVTGKATLPNCVSGYNQALNLEFNRYTVPGGIDFGYCNTGDVIAICFYSFKMANTCSRAFGSMRGLAVYHIARF